MRRCGQLLLIAALLPACAVGPDFHRPASPTVEQYGAEAPAATDSTAIQGGESQQFVAGAGVAVRWWEAFGSAPINDTVKRVLDANPDVQAVQAALRAALESAAAARGALFPSLQGSYNVEKQQDATGTLSPTLNSGVPIYTLHTLQLDVSYSLDLWGGNRRQLESLLATADAQRYQLDATRLTLVSNAVVAAITQASAQSQIDATQRVLDEERNALEIEQHLYDDGSVSLNEVSAQQALLSQAEATLPALQLQRTQQQDLLATLSGQAPAQMSPLTLDLSALTLPQNLPLTLPAQLVERRPDVRAAEAQLHAATAQVGVATANLLPNISLSADVGSVAVQLSKLLGTGTRFWSLGGTFSQTLFEGGALVHQKRAAVALMDEAGANYRSTVLAAFRQVADALAALQGDAQTLAAQQRAEQATAQSLALAQKNLTVGSASHLDLIQAEYAHETAVIALVQARAARLTDTVALYQALGGGDWAEGRY